jgi:hypothetical protein
MIEILAFGLAPGVDEDVFLAADRKVQTDFAYRQKGLLRRTTARSNDGAWIVIDIWQSERDADACAERWGQDPVTSEFMSFVDTNSIRTKRYATLD